MIRSQILIRLCFIDKVRPTEVKKSKYNVILHLADGRLISLMADIIKDKFISGAHRKGFQKLAREQGVLLHIQ